MLDRQNHSARNLLPIELTARLDLKDSNVLLNSGDEIHVATGSYHASGIALWDVEAGLLASAAAEQRVLVTADFPIHRALRSDGKCTLGLLGTQDPP